MQIEIGIWTRQRAERWIERMGHSSMGAEDVLYFAADRGLAALEGGRATAAPLDAGEAFDLDISPTQQLRVDILSERKGASPELVLAAAVEAGLCELEQQEPPRVGVTQKAGEPFIISVTGLAHA